LSALTLSTAALAAGSSASHGQSPLWYPVAEDAPRAPADGRRLAPAAVFRTFGLDQAALVDLLAQAPLESTDATRSTQVVIELPWPDGSFQRYRIEESPIMEAGLAARFPELKTYRGQGIDDRTASVRFDWTPSGFHAMVLSAQGTVFIDPYSRGDTRNYIVYYKRDSRPAPAATSWLVERGPGASTAERSWGIYQPPNGSTMRTYRTAVAATGEYTQFHGGTVSAAMSAITTTMNRVNGIFERDVAVRFTLVANNSSVVYTDPSTDPYTNGDAAQSMLENQATLDSVIGNANYDVGHVFATGGQAAVVETACNNPIKARGASGSATPVGDAFDVDHVAHAFGHHVGGYQTFNGTTGECEGGRAPASAWEPGSGSTLVSHAGKCSPENLQSNVDAYMHAGTINEIITYINNPSFGGGCGTTSSTGNTPPTVNAGADYTIPRNTPFTLTASGSDPDGDALTYTWEEMDLGTASPPMTDDGTRPLFRSFPGTTSPSRTFPQLSDILNNTSTIGEVLPSTTRSMNFRVTARDNRSGGGGTASDDMVLNVRSDAGPFEVTQPNTALTWAAGSTQTVTWNVANTTAAPVSCANVKISLSTDGGNTFPTVILASTPNDGSQAISVPGVSTTSARIKVEAVGNVFWDVSNVNFTINGGGLPNLSIGDVTVTEGNSGTVNAVFTAALSASSASTVTVAYATSNGTATAGSDYVAASGSVTFTPGQTTRTISVTVNGDTLFEPDETFFVDLSSASNAVISDAQGQGTINNDDAAPGGPPTLDAIAGGAVVVGGTNTLTGTNFTAGTVIKFFVNTGSAIEDVSGSGGFTPTAATPTSLTWDIPATIPLGEGFGSIFVVNTDQGFTVSNTQYALLDGDAADNLPTLKMVNGTSRSSSLDPGVPVAHTDTVVAPGATITIGGTGFNNPGVDVFAASTSSPDPAPTAVLCPVAKYGPAFPGGSATSLEFTVPANVPPGPAIFQLTNSPYAGNVKSNTASAVAGASPTITSVSIAGSTITVLGTGFSCLSVINLYNMQGAGVVNLGGISGGQRVIPLQFISPTELRFTRPGSAQAGAAFVEVLNPPYIPFSSSGNDPDGAFTFP
jgi:hypothetical protein